MAETVGFEPTCRLITDKTISNRSRYDHFDTSPYYILMAKAEKKQIARKLRDEVFEKCNRKPRKCRS